MKKRINMLLLALSSFIININVFAEEYIGDNFCDDEHILAGIGVVGYLLLILKIAIPIVIIIFGTLDLFKAIMDGKQDGISKKVKTLIIRVVIGVLIFFVPSIVKAFLPVFFDESTEKCESCLMYPSHCGVVVRNTTLEDCSKYQGSPGYCESYGCRWSYKFSKCVPAGSEDSSLMEEYPVLLQEKESKCKNEGSDSSCGRNGCTWLGKLGCHATDNFASITYCRKHQKDKDACKADNCSYSDVAGCQAGFTSTPTFTSKSGCATYAINTKCSEDPGCTWNAPYNKCLPKGYTLKEDERNEIKESGQALCDVYNSDSKEAARECREYGGKNGCSWDDVTNKCVFSANKPIEIKSECDNFDNSETECNAHKDTLGCMWYNNNCSRNALLVIDDDDNDDEPTGCDSANKATLSLEEKRTQCGKLVAQGCYWNALSKNCEKKFGN